MLRKKNYNKRKTYRVKNKKRNAPIGYSDNPGYTSTMFTVIPDRTVVTLKYTEKIQFNPAATSYEYIYRGNSINDPNFTGTGGRPVGYTEWSSFYNRYRVVGSIINLEILGSIATSICVFPSLSSTGVSGYADAVSQPYAKWIQVAGSGGLNVKRLSNKMGSAKISGQRIMQDDLYAASFGSDPNASWYWCLNMDAGASNVDITVTVTVFYRVVLYRKKSFDTSTLLAFHSISDDINNNNIDHNDIINK